MNNACFKPKRYPTAVITPRDLELLRALSSFGLITRPQIQVIFKWNCVSDVNRRLSKLVRAGYLVRRNRKGLSNPPIYLLGVNGINLLVDIAKADKALLNRRRFKFKSIGDNFLSHELAVTDFGCRFRAAVKEHPIGNIRTWISGDELVSCCNAVEEAGDHCLKPDAFFSFNFGILLFNAFLEIDMGTEPLSRLSKKVELYRAFKASGRFIEQFGSSAFRLLIITTSDGRAANIAQSLDDVCDFKIFISNHRSLQLEMLTASVWRRPGLKTLGSLHYPIELTGKKDANAVLS